jgi:transposase-like protein
MRRKTRKKESVPRRVFTDDFKQEAVRMLLDGHSTRSVCERLGLANANLLYRWKKEFLGKESGVASDLEQRVRTLEAELNCFTRSVTFLADR